MPAVTVPGFDVDTLKKNPVKFSPYSAYQVVNYLTRWPQSIIYWSFIFHHPDSRKIAQLWTSWQGDFDSLVLAFEGQSVAQWSSCCKPWNRSNTVKYETKEQQYVLFIGINFLLRHTHLESLFLCRLYLRIFHPILRKAVTDDSMRVLPTCLCLELSSSYEVRLVLLHCSCSAMQPAWVISPCFVLCTILIFSAVHRSSLQYTDLLCRAQIFSAVHNLQCLIKLFSASTKLANVKSAKALVAWSVASVAVAPSDKTEQPTSSSSSCVFWDFFLFFRQFVPFQ